MHKVHNSSREPRFMDQFQQAHGRTRHALGRLEDEGIAACDGHWKHPERNHKREIKWRDADADAQWMTRGPSINIGPNVLDGLPHHQAGYAAGKLYAFEATLERTA